MFGGVHRVNPSTQQSGLNDVPKWCVEVRRERIGTRLTDRIDSNGVVLVVEVGNIWAYSRDRSHLQYA